MDLQLLRRDDIWFFEKAPHGAQADVGHAVARVAG